VALETFSEIRKRHLGASLIVAGFVSEGDKHKPLICKIDQLGNVSISEDFECSGEGATVANPALLRREYNSGVSLMDAAFRLYEAKTLAEVFDSVGKDTSIDILYPDGELEQFSKRGFARLDTMLNRFSGKMRIAKPKLEKRYFESLGFSSLH
jgi:20S proteasome alpha/beta subunit